MSYPPSKEGNYPSMDSGASTLDNYRSPSKDGQSQSGNDGQWHPGNDTQWHPSNDGQWQSGNDGQWHPGNDTQWHPSNDGQWQSGNNGQWQSGNNGQWQSGNNGQWQSGNNGQWQSGNNGQWQSGNNGQWQSGNNGQWHSHYPQPPVRVPAYNNPTWERIPPPNSGQWNASLCGCGGNLLTCCMGFWCPCVLIGQNIEIIDRGATPCVSAGSIWALISCISLSFVGYSCGFVYSYSYRQRFREKFGLPSACPDVITECCCNSCSACQINQELKSRNIDPALGFERVRHIYDQPYDLIQAPHQQQMMS